MKKYILILLTFLACLALQTRCQQKKTPSGPEDEDPLTEIVYGDIAHATATCPQYDIDWPSLADSPWPMSVVDQQGLSRSSVPVLTQGTISWSIDMADFKEHGTIIEHGCAIGPDGTIYVMEQFDLSAITPDGEFKWVLPDSFSVMTGPIVGSDSTIYCGCKNWLHHGVTGGFVAVRPDGTVKWAIKRLENFEEIRPFMGVDGTIYTRNNDGMLYAINPRGTILWQKQVTRPGWNIITASPDGSVLYLNGRGSMLTAMDAATGAEYWSVETGIGLFHYASIDNQGNIYYYRAPTDTTREIVSLTPGGQERWIYPVDIIYKGAPNSGSSPMNGVSISYDGFLYIGFPGDAVYVLDYEGRLRWKYTPIYREIRTLGTLMPVICDRSGNVVCFDHWRAIIAKISDNGDLLYSFFLEDYFSSPRIHPCSVGMNGNLLVPYGGSRLMSLN